MLLSGIISNLTMPVGTSDWSPLVAVVELTWKRLCSYASLSFYAEFVTIVLTLASMIVLFLLFSEGETKVPAYHYLMLY